MRKSITQESDYGCGVACFAFVVGTSYREACHCLGSKQATSNRFWCKDLSLALNKSGIPCVHKYLKAPIKKQVYAEGTIVLIARSKTYPTGHYLVRHNGKWMDPWINLRTDRTIKNAKSGFRKRLPGRPMYAILPVV